MDLAVINQQLNHEQRRKEVINVIGRKRNKFIQVGRDRMNIARLSGSLNTLVTDVNGMSLNFLGGGGVEG